MGILTMKFGGSSVGSVPALTKMLSIIQQEHQQWQKIIVIVSALDGVTDLLLETAHLAKVNNQRGYRRITATLRTRHISLIETLPLSDFEKNALLADIDRLLFKMLDSLQEIAQSLTDKLSAKEIDAIVGVGEKMAARIIAALLRQHNLRGVAIDGSDIIVTDRIFGNANPLMPQTKQKIDEYLTPMLERAIIPVIAGYIGATEDGTPTTMGRGGSDYTATIVSTSINASEVWIWSTVDGMMSADPDEVADAHTIPELSYHEVAELAYFGARILHARMIYPLQERNIPIRIKNIFNANKTGTLIHAGFVPDEARIRAVTSVQGVALTANYNGSLAEITKIVDETLFQSIGNHADVMISSQSSNKSFLCFIVPPLAGYDMVELISKELNLAIQESAIQQKWQITPITVVTTIGEKIHMHPELSSKIFECLEGISILGVALGPSNSSFSIIVSMEEAEQTLKLLHRLTS